MSNIAISDLQSTASSLENDDLLLVSKKNGGTYTSMKMPGSVLKSGGTECLFTEDKVKNALTSYGAAKTSDVTSAKTAITTAISGLNNLSSSQVQSACSSAISSTNIGHIFPDYDHPERFLYNVNQLETLGLTKKYIQNISETDSYYKKAVYKIVDGSGSSNYIWYGSLNYDCVIEGNVYTLIDNYLFKMPIFNGFGETGSLTIQYLVKSNMQIGIYFPNSNYSASIIPVKFN